MKYAFVFLLFITGCAPVLQPRVFSYEKHIYEIASLSNGRMTVESELSSQCKGLEEIFEKFAIEQGLSHAGMTEGSFLGNSLETISYLNYAIPNSSTLFRISNSVNTAWRRTEWGYLRNYGLEFLNGYSILSTSVVDQKYSKISGSRICFSYSFSNV